MLRLGEAVKQQTQLVEKAKADRDAERKRGSTPRSAPKPWAAWWNAGRRKSSGSRTSRINADSDERAQRYFAAALLNN